MLPCSASDFLVYRDFFSYLQSAGSTCRLSVAEGKGGAARGGAAAREEAGARSGSRRHRWSRRAQPGGLKGELGREIVSSSQCYHMHDGVKRADQELGTT